MTAPQCPPADLRPGLCQLRCQVVVRDETAHECRFPASARDYKLLAEVTGTACCSAGPGLTITLAK